MRGTIGDSHTRGAVAKVALGTAAIAALFLLGAKGALAELRIDITRGRVEPLPIAVTNFLVWKTLNF